MEDSRCSGCAWQILPAISITRSGKISGVPGTMMRGTGRKEQGGLGATSLFPCSIASRRCRNYPRLGDIKYADAHALQAVQPHVVRVVGVVSRHDSQLRARWQDPLEKLVITVRS